MSLGRGSQGGAHVDVARSQSKMESRQPEDTEVIIGNFLVPKGTGQSLLPDRVTRLAATEGRRRPPTCEGTDSGEGMVYILCLLFFSTDTLIIFFLFEKSSFLTFVTFLNVKHFGILELHAVRKKSRLLKAPSDMPVDCQRCKPGRE